MRAALAILTLATALSASPSIYVDVPAAWSSAVDHAHTRAFGAGLEIPLAAKFAAVARGRYLLVEQSPWSQEDRIDRYYSLGEPAGYSLWAFQAAGRAYPWEWLPGFYAEALAGVKRIAGGNPQAAPSFDSEIRIPAGIRDFTTWAFEGGVGFGYRWSWSPTRLSLGFMFGPEWVLRRGVDADGKTIRRREWSASLLRFNSLELGFGF